MPEQQQKREKERERERDREQEAAMLFDSFANNTPEIMQHQITAVKQDDNKAQSLLRLTQRQSTEGVLCYSLAAC